VSGIGSAKHQPDLLCAKEYTTHNNDEIRGEQNMELRVCGTTGLQLSVLGYGCWQFGGGAYWGESDQQTVTALVRTAVDAGITYFDTAEMYNEGRSEEFLGNALKGIPRPRSGRVKNLAHQYASGNLARALRSFFKAP
jgi:predicted aldo/keto reductase-like oxidoreductase